jgi:hypothetical protein
MGVGMADGGLAGMHWMGWGGGGLLIGTALAEAMRTNTTLTELTCNAADAWPVDTAVQVRAHDGA